MLIAAKDGQETLKTKKGGTPESSAKAEPPLPFPSDSTDVHRPRRNNVGWPSAPDSRAPSQIRRFRGVSPDIVTIVVAITTLGSLFSTRLSSVLADNTHGGPRFLEFVTRKKWRSCPMPVAFSENLRGEAKRRNRFSGTATRSIKHSPKRHRRTIKNSRRGSSSTHNRIQRREITY